jgi:hypothetical protein
MISARNSRRARFPGETKKRQRIVLRDELSVLADGLNSKERLLSELLNEYGESKELHLAIHSRVYRKSSRFKSQSFPFTAKLQNYLTWKWAEGILLECQSHSSDGMLPSDIIDKFNRESRSVPLILEIDWTSQRRSRRKGNKEDQGDQEGKDSVLMQRKVLAFGGDKQFTVKSDVIYLLWNIFLDKRKRERLKKCQLCEQWFVDRTRNHTKMWDSAKCKWKSWNRGKRRQAQHRQYSARPKT